MQDLLILNIHNPHFSSVLTSLHQCPPIKSQLKVNPATVLNNVKVLKPLLLSIGLTVSYVNVWSVGIGHQLLAIMCHHDVYQGAVRMGYQGH